MRIALVASACSPVRPDHAGSVEQLVWLLAREMTRLGHEVTVFGCAGAACAGRFVATLPGPHGADGSPDDWMLCEWTNLSRAVAESDQFDMIHSHVYLWGVPLQQLARCPMLHTQHILPYDDDAAMWRLHPGTHVTALSHYQWSSFSDLHPIGIVPHGVAVEQFDFSPEPDDYLCYLGRFVADKGPLDAIALAKSAGLRLLMAGPRNDFFDQQIAPHVDGRQIAYVGAVDAAQRGKLLGGARALLYPLREPEPFGLVQVEAMMCGTPVVATHIGAIPEIVDEDITGCTADRIDRLDDALRRALALDRRTVRAVAERRFSGRRMAEQYLQIYQSIATSTDNMERENVRCR
jgi:glycosyltransferase involved in cell wall biosynthesis